MNASKGFSKFARLIADFSGHPMAFLIASGIILAWLVSGPIFNFSDTWQLVINTGTTIITFLMVFLIQNTQNRDSTSIHIKLDELIRAHEGAHNALMDLEEETQEELDALRKKYEAHAAKARGDLGQGKKDTDSSDI